MSEESAPGPGSIIDPCYTSGDYFRNPHRYAADAALKAGHFERLLRRSRSRLTGSITSYVDIGCGSGEVVVRVGKALRDMGFPVTSVAGYDVSPHVRELRHEGVRFVCGDFCASDETADLVTLFDVFEHVPDPVDFLKQVARRCRFMGFHIPLDNSLNYGWRNKFRPRLHDPGHLLVMDTAAALNFLAMAGLRVVDYEYTFGFMTGSGRTSTLAKVTLPLRWMLARISPWMMSKTVGGASLAVLALTPSGMNAAAEP
jgi:SAM-dependent methyltransferase